MNTYLRELTVQFAKFGIVGVIAFCIDYGLFLLMTYVFGINYLIASAISFVISTIFNFTASMRYVFAGKRGQTRSQQFVIFFVLSVVGLGVNQLVLWMCVARVGRKARGHVHRHDLQLCHTQGVPRGS